jgi:hypothetical protein
MKSLKPLEMLLLIIALTGWFALIAQFVLLLQNRTSSVPESIARYFSYFTILTNLLVALYCSILLLTPKLKWGLFFSKSNTSAVVAVYIFIVGLVYNVILRSLWSPAGLQKIVDELLHSLIPLLYLLYWLLWADKGGLKWKNAFTWLIYPWVYLLYILIRGSLSGFYPYPFIHAGELGYGKALLNSLFMVFVFLGFSLLFIGISNQLAAKKMRK